MAPNNAPQQDGRNAVGIESSALFGEFVFHVEWKGQLVGRDIWKGKDQHIEDHMRITPMGRVLWLSHEGWEDVTADCKLTLLPNTKMTRAAGDAHPLEPRAPVGG